mmetsp:Transcript_10554/g.25784  ORF Transcript_10554/g.25784 Transcript_10554/m.25784 type:complete len:154 (+) Transcript_10554:1603-2064(+)
MGYEEGNESGGEEEEADRSLGNEVEETNGSEIFEGAVLSDARGTEELNGMPAERVPTSGRKFRSDNENSAFALSRATAAQLPAHSTHSSASLGPSDSPDPWDPSELLPIHAKNREISALSTRSTSRSVRGRTFSIRSEARAMTRPSSFDLGPP